MPDQDHVAILRRGPRAWNAWRDDNPAAPANLNGISLKLGERQMGPINGGPINLRGAHLRAATLRYASLLSANLEGAELADADLTHARLDGANLTGADLSNASLDHADLHAANLSGANLSGASLLEVRNLSQKQLDDSLGDGATLLPARLARPARWPGASIARRPADRAPVAQPHESPERASPAERAWTLQSLVPLAAILLVGAGGLLYVLNTRDADRTESIASRNASHDLSPGEPAGDTSPAIPLEPRRTDLRSPDLIPTIAPTQDLVGDATVPSQETARHGTDPDRVSPAEATPLPTVEKIAPPLGDGTDPDRASPAEETPLPTVKKIDPPLGDVPPTALALVGAPTVPAAPPSPAATTAALPQADLRVTTVPDALEPAPPLPSRKPAARNLAAIPKPQGGGIEGLPPRAKNQSTPRKTPEAAGRAAVSDVLAGGL